MPNRRTKFYDSSLLSRLEMALLSSPRIADLSSHEREIFWRGFVTSLALSVRLPVKILTALYCDILAGGFSSGFLTQDRYEETGYERSYQSVERTLSVPSLSRAVNGIQDVIDKGTSPVHSNGGSKEDGGK